MTPPFRLAVMAVVGSHGQTLASLSPPDLTELTAIHGTGAIGARQFQPPSTLATQTATAPAAGVLGLAIKKKYF